LAEAKIYQLLDSIISDGTGGNERPGGKIPGPLLLAQAEFTWLKLCE
jgi:hypothetical protein